MTRIVATSIHALVAIATRQKRDTHRYDQNQTDEHKCGRGDALKNEETLRVDDGGAGERSGNEDD